MAAENCGIEAGEVVDIWGCGTVAKFAIQSDWMLGAGRVIAIERVENRSALARDKGRAKPFTLKTKTCKNACWK